MIDQVMGRAVIKNSRLQGWLERIDFLWKTQDNYTIQHIERRYNKDADSLSKKGLQANNEEWHLEITWEQSIFNMESFPNPF